MKKSFSAALGAYAGIMTLAVAYLGLTALSPAPRITPELNVERINIREPDGTLRLAISNHARIPGIIVDGKEYPNANRTDAGMIFYNDDGDENGGLVFDGGIKDGRPTNGGSLTFDRWHQDQTIQLTSTENGDQREAAVRINDRPDGPMDVARGQQVLAMPAGPARDAAFKAANFGVAQRAYLGRTPDKASELILRDGDGRARLRLRVTEAGAARIEFLDRAGNVIRAIDPPAS